MTQISVLGAGAFGTALATNMAANGKTVSLWGRDTDQIRAMKATGKNKRYLPNSALSPKLYLEEKLDAAMQADILLCVVPAQKTRQFLESLPGSHRDKPLVLCAKGLENSTGLRQSEIAEQFWDPRKIFVLSGPGFADEIASDLPTALSLGAKNQVMGAQLQDALSSQRMRLYLGSDVVGVELGGALKNVLAIACGMVFGAGLGESAKAATMTRGFREIVKVATSLGAHENTLYGLSGFGDLVLTASSEKSRNYAYGLKLAKSSKVEISTTVEGVSTAAAIADLCATHGWDLPLCNAVADVINGTRNLTEVLEDLMARPLKFE